MSDQEKQIKIDQVTGNLTGNIATGDINIYGDPETQKRVEELVRKIEQLEEARAIMADNTAIVAQIETFQQELASLSQQFEQANSGPLKQQRLYLKKRQAEVSHLSSLIYIDAKTATRQLQLAQVYTALLTRSSEEQGHLFAAKEKGELPKPVSVLAELNKHPHLVIIGDPGSGKSTFVDFVMLCMAGELLGDEQTGLSLLRTPLPKEENNDKDPTPQPWDHEALLPVKVVLRKFTAEGLPPIGKTANSEHLWAYLGQQLAAEGLADYAPTLKEHFLHQGGLLLFDGLDEVPDPETRIPQLKQVIEDIATCHECRVVVTSRPYAYQKEAWRLNTFAQTTLAEFSSGQIKQFIQGWYAYLGRLYQWSDDLRQRRAEQLQQAIFSKPQLKPLAERPLLLTLMVNLHASKGTLPEKRADLYENTVDLLLDRWELGRLGADQSVITQRLSDWLNIAQSEIRALLESLAFDAHANQPETTAGTANLDGQKLAWGLLDLTQETIHPNELLKFLDQRAGILVGAGGHVYRFPHRTFQEYLAACYIAQKEAFAEQIAQLVREDTNRWREVALLVGAKVGAKGYWAGAIWLVVEQLCPQTVPTDVESLPATSMMSAILAGQMLVETENTAPTSTPNQAKLTRVCDWLKAIVKTGHLPAREQMTAGQLLAQIGTDDRPGVTGR